MLVLQEGRLRSLGLEWAAGGRVEQSTGLVQEDDETWRQCRQMVTTERGLQITLPRFLSWLHVTSLRPLFKLPYRFSNVICNMRALTVPTACSQRL